MLALDENRDLTQADPLQEVAPEVAPEAAAPEVAASEAPTATEAPFAEPGALPDLADTEMAATAGPTASEQAYDADAAARAEEEAAEARPLHGLFMPEDYVAACEAAGTPHKWDPKYAAGYTSAHHWTQPYDGREDNNFTLKKWESASAALTAFMAGPSIGSFELIAVVVELDEMRQNLGDKRFDDLFGSSDHDIDGRIPAAQRLRISAAMYTVPFVDQMMALAAEAEAGQKAAPQPVEPVAEFREEAIEQRIQDQPAPELIADELGIQREQREQQLA